MARMIPDLDVRSIPNDGERSVYGAAQRLPDEYTVLYSFKYGTSAPEDPTQRQGEADFVIVHPSLGYLVIEVKQGDVVYANGRWHEYKGGGYRPMAKDPAEQAERAMYAILSRYKQAARTSGFPLKIRYAICFPECTKIAGLIPPHVDPRSIWCFQSVEKLEESILALFGGRSLRPEASATEVLVNKVLAPEFKLFARLDQRIEMFHQASERVLTEEQSRILDETELDKRKVFFGAAGTGKTFLAMEKARRLAAQGKRVFLTCFNKNLGRYLERALQGSVVASNFHDYLLHVLKPRNPELVPPSGDAAQAFYDETLVDLAFDHYATLDESEKFDSVLVDEGQDFKESWFVLLESMVKRDGEFYVFADPNQDLFSGHVESLKSITPSRHRLTRNLRNTEQINDWINRFVKEGGMKPALTGGLPVVRLGWDTYAEERRMVEQEIGRLVSQGVKPLRIMILSPNRQDNSSLAGLNRIKEWPLVDFREERANGIRFATIRSFKGLEADIVFLIGLKEGKQTCTATDIYVGASRARFLLYVFYNKKAPPRGRVSVIRRSVLHLSLPSTMSVYSQSRLKRGNSRMPHAVETMFYIQQVSWHGLDDG